MIVYAVIKAWSYLILVNVIVANSYSTELTEEEEEEIKRKIKKAGYYLNLSMGEVIILI